jgi:type II secretory pathway component PulF
MMSIGIDLSALNADSINLWLARQSFLMNAAARRRLWIKLAKLLSNGVPIMSALESFRQHRLTISGPNDPQVIGLNEWMAGMRNGRRLADVLQGWASLEECMLISAGEQAGTLEKTLRSTVTLMTSKSKISNAVIKGLTYPVILLLAGFGVLQMFSAKVIPAFSRIVSDEKWTGWASATVKAARLADHWLWLLGVLTVALIVAFFVSLPRWDGKLRIRLDRYAPYSVYRMLHGTSFMIALAAMIESGMRLELALQQLAQRAPRWLRARIHAAMVGMQSGLTMGDALQKSGYEFPDREIISDLMTYSNQSGFEDALILIGREWLEEAVGAIEDRMAAVFAGMIAVVGGLLAFIVGGFVAMQVQMTTILQHTGR